MNAALLNGLGSSPSKKVYIPNIIALLLRHFGMLMLAFSSVQCLTEPSMAAVVISPKNPIKRKQNWA